MLTDNDEEFGALLRGADPVRARALPDPDDPAALRIRTQARQRSRRRRIRHLVVIPVVSALAVGGATAAALTLVGDGHVSNTATLECVHPSGAEGSIEGFPIALTAADAEATCRGYWEAGQNWVDWGDWDGGERPGPVEGPLTACAPGDGRGGVRVYAGGPDVCEEHDEVPYVGPSDEQERLAEFVEALPDGLKDLINPEDPCPSFPELETRLYDLLAAHDLAGWTVVDAAPPGDGALTLTYFNEDGSTCAGLSYQEEERKIFTRYHAED
ncbi:hypothetical protein [Streptomyces sp. 6N223]|uniref:hypothetical protein n=1 Tax=Streptomyces sp. 6N223 TaxID=3457412 RepID=UPI003FD1318D